MTVTASVWPRTALGVAALAMTYGSAGAVELNAAAIAIKFPESSGAIRPARRQ
jgi:hypothetical protein